VKVEGDHHM